MQGRSKMTSASGAEQMMPHGGIRGRVESGDGNDKSGDRGIETHGGASGSIGQIIKRGAIESEIKPSSPKSKIKPSTESSEAPSNQRSSQAAPNQRSSQAAPTRLKMRGSTYVGAESSGMACALRDRNWRPEGG
jgi:hypothetical protein